MKTEENSTTLTSGGLLARNAILNFVGRSAPFAIAIFAIPMLIKGLGTDRFGVLTLVWMLIGYFNLFDLGLGRALTKLVAEKLGTGEEDKIPTLVWTGLLLMMVLGILGALVIVLLTPWLVYHGLKIPEPLRIETQRSFYLLSLSIPLVISTVGLRGILEAQQRFGLISLARIMMGVFTLAAPLAVLPFTNNLFPIVAVLALGRLIAWVAHIVICLNAMPTLRHKLTIKTTLIAPILRFGGWITVSNIISPVMVYLDRFFIGALISMAAVAYYVTPFEMVTKLLLVPISLAGVLFPAFTTTLTKDPKRTGLLFDRGLKFVFLLLFPVTLLIVTMAREGLDLWLGVDFAQNSTRVLQFLAIGVFVNSIANLPYNLVQSAGRPDLTAKLHLMELPFYLLAIWWMINQFGIEGAAMTWLTRILIDAVVLYFISRRLLQSQTVPMQTNVIHLLIALVILLLAMLPSGITMNLLFLFTVLPVFFLISWYVILSANERFVMQGWLKKGLMLIWRTP
jgi:O-antigen/teichoic acid export membrane protein